MKEGDMGMGRRGVRFLEDEREWRLPCLLDVDDLGLWDKSEEFLRVMLARFAEMYRKRCVKDNESKRKVMILGEEEELECEIYRGGNLMLENVIRNKRRILIRSYG